MPRARRLHAPGFIFHVTSRCQGKAHLFDSDPLRDEIVGFICDAATGSATRLLAFAVMTNHLHLIVRQGADPLGWMVQRILQRTASLIRRRRNHRDHVFGGRFWSGICDDPRYLRQIILYTHLNPVRAGLCKAPDEYAWTSHACYSGTVSDPTHLSAVQGEYGRRFFACEADDDASARTNYDACIEYWLRREPLPLGAMYLIPEGDTPPPLTHAGDSFWSQEFGDVVRPPAGYSPLVDIRDRAVSALRAVAPDVTLNDLRSAGKTQPLSRIRRHVVAILIATGYPNGAIARCLNISTSLVSAVAREVRTGLVGSRG